MYRKTYVEIDVSKIEQNIKNIKKEYPDYKYYIGVVKGNCYGHGSYLTKYIVSSGINYLAVSTLEEAMEIRKYTDIDILLLEPIAIDSIEEAIKLGLTITISSVDYYHELIKKAYKNLKVHLKLNTGMNRLGINNKDDVKKIYDELINNKNISLEGIYTHFSTTGIQDKMYDKQLEKFIELTSLIDLNKIKIVHLGRSSSLQLHPRIEFANGIRIGIIMYGIGQSFNRYHGFKGSLRKLKHNFIVKKDHISKVYESSDLKLEVAFKLKSEIIEINKVEKGSLIGYGGTYEALKDEYVAVCPVGYADGLNLNFKNLKVKINDKYYNIVGIINMGMITILVDEDIKVGDTAIIIGNDIKKEAKLTQNTVYTIMTSINQNVPRVYIKDNKVDKEI